MAQQLAFVIPGIYISKQSLQSVNDDTPKQFIRVYGESETRENYFVIDDGKELPEYAILEDYELYSVVQSDNVEKSLSSKQKQLMRGFEPIEKPEETVAKPVVEQPLRNSPEITTLSGEDVLQGKIIAPENLRETSIHIPYKLTEFEEITLKQFSGKVEQEITIPEMVMSCNLNFDSLASAIKMFSLNRKNIAQRIAYEFINNPMFFETLSDIIDKMLDSDVEQKKKTTQAKVEEPVLETEEVHEVIEEKPVEETQHTEAETDDSLQEKKNSVDEYLKSHGLI
jgi:hypothetical protein